MEPEAALHSGVSQMRAAGQEGETGPAILHLHHGASGALEDNRQGRSRLSRTSYDVEELAAPYLVPVSSEPSCFPPALPGLSWHASPFSCLTEHKCGFFFHPQPFVSYRAWPAT